MNKIRNSATRVALAGALALLVSAPFAFAAEQTREGYVAQVEPIVASHPEAATYRPAPIL